MARLRCQWGYQWCFLPRIRLRRLSQHRYQQPASRRHGLWTSQRSRKLRHAVGMAVESCRAETARSWVGAERKHVGGCGCRDDRVVAVGSYNHVRPVQKFSTFSHPTQSITQSIPSGPESINGSTYAMHGHAAANSHHARSLADTPGRGRLPPAPRVIALARGAVKPPRAWSAGCASSRSPTAGTRRFEGRSVCGRWM